MARGDDFHLKLAKSRLSSAEVADKAGYVLPMPPTM